MGNSRTEGTTHRWRTSWRPCRGAGPGGLRHDQGRRAAGQRV